VGRISVGICSLWLFSTCVFAEDNAQLLGKYKSLETLARGLFYLQNLYVDPSKVKQDNLVNLAMRGIVEQLDPHTVYMAPQAFKQLTMDTQGKFGGVGIIVSQEGKNLIVVSAIEDTPAERAGVQSGDQIVEINGKPLGGEKNEEAVERMRGAPGTVLELKVRRKNEPKLLEFSLKRQIIRIQSVVVKELSPGIAYARIRSFQEKTATDLDKGLKKIKNLSGVVLDLRDNPGGLLDQAVQVSDLFLASGLIVSTVGRDPERVEREFAHQRETLPRMPMVTLINGGSASASEIVAGALQDHERALILGSTSFGKGSVQTLVSLPNGAGLKLTVARYFTPKDRSIQAKGIEPDIFVPKKAPKKMRAETKGKMRMTTEADLEGHIDSSDLSELARGRGLKKYTDKWGRGLKKDNQVLTAFAYLRSYSLFKEKK
jgi:carboxyl-terminal processing protease